MVAVSANFPQFPVSIDIYTHAAEAVAGAVRVPLAWTPAGGHCACALGLGEGRGRGALTNIIAALGSS